MTSSDQTEKPTYNKKISTTTLVAYLPVRCEVLFVSLFRFFEYIGFLLYSSDRAASFLGESLGRR